METYADFRESYIIQTFVNKVNTKLWNNCRVYLTDDFYYNVDQNSAILWISEKLNALKRSR